MKPEQKQRKYTKTKHQTDKTKTVRQQQEK
jgi:hypothetical protein